MSFKEFMLSKSGYYSMIVVLYIVIWGIMLAFTAIDIPIVAVIFALVLGYFGWKAFNKITPDIFLFMPIAGWIVYFIIKGVLSIIIGMFVAPLQIAKMISASIQKNIQ